MQRDQRSNCQHPLDHQKKKKKERENSRKTFTSALLTTPKSLTVWITMNCGQFWKKWEIPDPLTCLLRNLYAGQEAKVGTRHGTMDYLQIGKGAHQGRTPSPCLFNAVCVIGNARLEEAQAVSNTVGRNINNLRYADDATFVAEKKKKKN